MKNLTKTGSLNNKEALYWLDARYQKETDKQHHNRQSQETPIPIEI